MERLRKTRFAIALSALAFYALFVWRTSFVVDGRRYFVLFEDAMISMRYARNLAEGHGFVWNVGEPPIEGFTNLLWTLWMSVAHLAGLSESKISLFIMLSGVAILLALGLVTSRIARLLSDEPWVPVAVLAATLFDYPVVFWTLRGMEVGALALAVYTLLWLTLENEESFSLRRTVAMSLLMAVSVLLRSDSVVPLALIGLYGLATASRRLPFVAIMALFPGVALAGQMAFRIHYFHDRLPNTYYLKLFHIALSDRLKRGAFVALDVLGLHLAIPVAVAAASVLGWRRDFFRDKAARRQALLAAVFAAQIAYASYVGGDAWEWMLYANRYMCIGMPALVLLGALAIARVARADADGKARFVRQLTVALFALGAMLVGLNVAAKLRPEHGVAATIVFSKTAFAFGALLLLLGALLLLSDSRRAVLAGLGAVARRMAATRTVGATIVLLTLVLWLPSHALPMGRWLAQNAAQFKDEARYTRLGLLIRATTPPDFRMAVAAAGATPYFSRRPTEDILGKNDAHIAKLAPRGVFSPGHDKWDYRYSLEERDSKMIVELVDMNAEDDAYVASLGFEEQPNELKLRKDAQGVNRAVFGAVVDDGEQLAAALREAGSTLPPAFGGRDVAMVLAFGALIAAAFFGVVRRRDDDGALTREEPEPDPDEARELAALEEPHAEWGLSAKQIPTLDGMRGIAVIVVLMFHFAWTFPEEGRAAAALHGLLWSGWIGVDLFFVLSGFLITRGLVAPSQKPLGTRMKMFWMRRVLRIFPLYYAVLVVGAVVALALGRWVPTASYWLYMQNYTLAFDDEVMRWTAHFWSLAIEEQFYFLWPLLAFLAPKKRLVPTALVLIAACVVLRAAITFKLGVHVFGWDELTTKKFAYRATFTRADGLLMGALVAVLQRQMTHSLSFAWRRLRLPLFALAAAMLAGLYLLAGGLDDYDRRVIGVGYFLLALLFASAISMCADGAVSERVRRVLSSRPLVACGKVSYGMYIFHWPLVVLSVPTLERMQATMGQGARIGLGLAWIAAATAFIYGVAWVSFTFFETPFLKLKRHFHD